jgi:hypothetical protein
VGKEVGYVHGVYEHWGKLVVVLPPMVVVVCDPAPLRDCDLRDAGGVDRLVLGRFGQHSLQVHGEVSLVHLEPSHGSDRHALEKTTFLFLYLFVDCLPLDLRCESGDDDASASCITKKSS